MQSGARGCRVDRDGARAATRARGRAAGDHRDAQTGGQGNFEYNPPPIRLSLLSLRSARARAHYPLAGSVYISLARRRLRGAGAISHARAHGKPRNGFRAVVVIVLIDGCCRCATVASFFGVSKKYICVCFEFERNFMIFFFLLSDFVKL